MTKILNWMPPILVPLVWMAVAPFVAAYALLVPNAITHIFDGLGNIDDAGPY